MAELKAFAEQAPLGGAILHLGATSMDIEDNADVLRVRQALDLILNALRGLLLDFARQIELWAETPLIAFTHLQPAEPSTLGYRLAGYAQDLLLDWEALQAVRKNFRGKGFKGAVGSGAAYAELIGMDHLAEFEQRLSQRLELPFFPIATQVYPRKQDYALVSALAGLAAACTSSLSTCACCNPRRWANGPSRSASKQVGSSAMPFKRNPISAEKIDSLAAATGANCRAWPGTTLRTRCWSARWTIRPTAVCCYRRPS